MEFLKKNLVKIMEEVNSMDVGEMAQRQLGTQGDRYYKSGPLKGQRKWPKFVSGWHPDNPTPMGEEGIPDFWIVNATESEGGEILVVPLDCDELNEFLEKNTEWLNSLRIEHELEPQIVACPRSKTHRTMERLFAGGYQPSGAQISEQERIFRYSFYPIMRNSFSKGDFAKVLESRSIPCVAIDEEYMDMYQDKVTNKKLRFRSHSYELFKSVPDFIATVRSRRLSQRGVGGEFALERDPVTCTRIARQYNLEYQNWWEGVKNKDEYKGKTKKYLLNRFGLENGNLNVATRLDVIIDGDLNEENNTYRWKIDFIVSFGKKTEDEMTISGGLNEERTFSTIKEVSYELKRPFTRFDNKYSVLDNPSIRSGFLEAIDDIQNQISSLKSNWMLPIATQARLDIR